MDWALAMPPPAPVHHLQQMFYLFVGRMLCPRGSDENSRRMWLGCPVVRLLVRDESEFFSTSDLESINVPKF